MGKVSDIEALQVFEVFKKLHPNNTELFVNTLANIDRWRAHINNTERIRAMYSNKFSTEFAPDFQTLINNRRADTFEGLSFEAQQVYILLPPLFLGRRVFAVGSRVRGDYIEHGDPVEVRQWRLAAGHSDKEESDFDFVVEGLDPDGRELPDGCDWLRYNPGDKQISIPMPIHYWDFKKLPQSEFARVKQLLQQGDERELLKLHNQYQLSENNYCCNLNGLMQWFRGALSEGLLNEKT